MTIVDANVLLYAVNTSSRQHPAAKGLLDGALSDDVRVGIPWPSRCWPMSTRDMINLLPSIGTLDAAHSTIMGR